MTDISDKIAEFIRRGAIQLSRKYRTIAVAPELPEGVTFLDELKVSDPRMWASLERCARESILRNRRDLHVELSFEEFNEWLQATGRKPSSGAPEPFKTWGEYWRAHRGVDSTPIEDKKETPNG